MERRSPTGDQRVERETRPNNAAPRQSHSRESTLSPPVVESAWSWGPVRGPPGASRRQRETRTCNACGAPISRLSFHALVITVLQNHGDRDPPFPTGFRAGARNRGQRTDVHCPICFFRAASPRIATPRRITGTWSQFSRWGPPTGIARERETRTNNAAPRQSHRCEPTYRHSR